MVLAAVLSAIASLITSLAILLSVFKNGRTADRIHTEVKTINGRSLAQLADADETRRIEAEAPQDITVNDQAHLDATNGMPK